MQIQLVFLGTKSLTQYLMILLTFLSLPRLHHVLEIIFPVPPPVLPEVGLVGSLLLERDRIENDIEDVWNDSRRTGRLAAQDQRINEALGVTPEPAPPPVVIIPDKGFQAPSRDMIRWDFPSWSCKRQSHLLVYGSLGHR